MTGREEGAPGAETTTRTRVGNYTLCGQDTELQDTEPNRSRRHDTDCDINDCQRIQVDYYLMPIIISTIHRPRTRKMAIYSHWRTLEIAGQARTCQDMPHWLTSCGRKGSR